MRSATHVSAAHRVMVAALVVAAAGLGTEVAVRARQGRGGGGAGAAPIPMAAGTLVRSPEGHYGETVSLLAPIGQVLSKTTFTVSQVQGKTTDKDILVVAPTLQAPVPAEGYVTVVGVVFKFDTTELARRARGYTIDLAPDVVESYKGRTAVAATAVITPKLIDIAKKPLAPPTPEENAFDKVMLNEVNPSFTALRDALTSSNADGAKTNAATLKKAFTTAAAFFTSRKTPGAVSLAEQALKFATDIETAAAAGKWADAQTSATSLQGMCTACHGAWRERADDGTFRVKAGPGGGL